MLFFMFQPRTLISQIRKEDLVKPKLAPMPAGLIGIVYIKSHGYNAKLAFYKTF